EILPDVRDRESLDDALTQFLLAGEGGNEHFRGYVDRFAVWRRMCHDGIAGLIRGDECFGWDKRFPDASDVGIRRGLGGTMLADLFDERQLDVLELPGQTWPETLRRRADEPEEIYAVRLNHSYRTPVVKSALTDAKAGHVDIVTPFQTRRVIEFVRTLPPELIKGKRLFKAYALRCSRVDIATAPAIRPHYKLFDESIFFELLRDCHERGLTRGVVPEPFVLWTLGRLELPAGAPQKSWRAALKATAKRVLGRNGEGRQSGPPMPLNVFAFRCLLASKVSLMFSQDAEEHRPAELRLPARQVSKESV
ncbi:MAG TPA: hypothetical protein VGV38_10730, partial [Pyrinomonadaceae bacterium]|nr:hypothetical protein [Pyrinomonadaceae bacterium]